MKALLRKLFGKNKGVRLEKKKYEWPKCEPIDKTDPYWELNNNSCCNGIQYHKVEVTPGNWEWKVHEGIMKLKRDDNERREGLWLALRSRLLTKEEMEEVRMYGSRLNIQEMVSYNEQEKTNELTVALNGQALMQMAFMRGAMEKAQS